MTKHKIKLKNNGRWLTYLNFIIQPVLRNSVRPPNKYLSASRLVTIYKENVHKFCSFTFSILHMVIYSHYAQRSPPINFIRKL